MYFYIVMLVIKEKPVKSYLECPNCGEYHEFDETRPAERVVCLFCDEVFNTGFFEPFAIAYRKKEQ